ncbi:MAG: hypothetical protein AMS19_10365 [Gemmatimonas sp. SG8_23]|nr:MAG: hypothetical protein AMS19_10365 [Gemmatimonas sp. SG8_23]
MPRTWFPSAQSAGQRRGGVQDRLAEVSRPAAPSDRAQIRTARGAEPADGVAPHAALALEEGPSARRVSGQRLHLVRPRRRQRADVARDLLGLAGGKPPRAGHAGPGDARPDDAYQGRVVGRPVESGAGERRALSASTVHAVTASAARDVVDAAVGEVFGVRAGLGLLRGDDSRSGHERGRQRQADRDPNLAPSEAAS